MKYVVQETVTYHVEAESEEAAVNHVIDDGERDKHCFYGVADREAWELNEDPYTQYGTPEHEAVLIEEERGT